MNTQRNPSQFYLPLPTKGDQIIYRNHQMKIYIFIIKMVNCYSARTKDENYYIINFKNPKKFNTNRSYHNGCI